MGNRILCRNANPIGNAGVPQIESGVLGQPQDAVIYRASAPEAVVELIRCGVSVFHATQQGVIGPLLQDRTFPKVAVEGQEGGGEGYAVFAEQLYKALHIGAVREPLVHVGLVRVRKGNGYRDLRGGVGRNGDGSIGGAGGDGGVQLPGIVADQVGDLAVLELAPLGNLAQDGGIQVISFVCVGEVYHLEVHGVGAGAVRVVPQFKFGFVVPSTWM